MQPQRIFGIALLVIGTALFIFGLNASDSLTNSLSEFFTGHFTDTTTWYLLGGLALAIVGLGLAVSSGRVLKS